jgi:hypothetical protein
VAAPVVSSATTLGPEAPSATEVKRTLPKLNLEVLVVAVLVAASLLMIVVAAFLSSQGAGPLKPVTQEPLSALQPTPHIPGIDSDNDGLFDIDENYIYGTDVTKVDTDGDGMPDPWEVQYKDTRNAETRELVIDPVDPTDAYEDPDNDGYDFNNNARVDSFQDSVLRSNLSIPPKSQYTTLGVCALSQNQLAYDGTLVRFALTAVMDNGTYGDPDTNPSSALNVHVTDVTTRSEGQANIYTPRDECDLRIELTPGSSRPAQLAAWQQRTGGWIEGDLINLEGLFHVDPDNAANYWLEVRGGETFPNIQEYQTWHDYDASGRLTGSSPLIRDTDGDGMWDGFEAHYGKGHALTTNGSTVLQWVWDFFLSPVNTTDARLDPDNDGIMISYQEYYAPNINRACLPRDPVNGTCLREVPPDVTPSEFVLAGTNIDEFYLHTRPDQADSDNDTYPEPEEGVPITDWNTADMQEVLILGTNPINADTDGDGMDDGWEVFYSLLPLNGSDKFQDPDNDSLPNINEYINPGCRLSPRNNDTDQDLLPDGWEVQYTLDSCHNDALQDVDLTRGVVTPDGLTNLQEFYAKTNPRRIDTDGDSLSDFDEVTKTWTVSVEGKIYSYRTDATSADTDIDDRPDDEDGDGSSAPCEEVLDGNDNDGDAKFLQNDNLDNDLDGVIDDGPFGKVPTAGPAGTEPSSWVAEGVDEEHDLCDWNEVTIFKTNATNADTDLEGLSDWVELFSDRNESKPGTQGTNPNLKDSDGDKLDDYSEVPHLIPGGLEECMRLYLPGFTDNVTRCTDPLNPDTDGDGLEDGFEVNTDWIPGNFIAGTAKEQVDSTDPTDPDTDGDGLTDGFEFDNSDIDGDGLPTSWEIDFLGIYPLAYKEVDANGNLIDDVNDDFDGDGLTNMQEYILRLNPIDLDSDGDNVIDTNEQPGKFYIPRLPVFADTDGDLMPDWWEKANLFDPLAPSQGCSADADNDQFYDLDEYLYNTPPRGHLDEAIPDRYNHVFISNPLSCDADHDGMADGWETFYGLNPSDPADYGTNLDKELNATHEVDPDTGVFILADNWTNWEEYIYASAPNTHISTNPRMGDSDFDAWDNPGHPVIRIDGSFNFTQTRVDYQKFYTDDKDPDPVILWHAKRPVNPSVNASALNPVRREQDASGDIDRDGINNTVEAVKRTSAFDPDTDGDGMPDGWEVQYAIGNATTGKPILDPLYPGDANQDPDNDGWNYSRVTDSSQPIDICSGSYPAVITRRDFNGDGAVDEYLDNEQFTNIEEYWFGDDVDGDGINEVTTHPGKKITAAAQNCQGPIDGFVQYFKDRDFDQLPRWYEVMFAFDDADRTGVNGREADPDLDGWKTVIEARSTPWFNPRDPASHPEWCNVPREFLPDPNQPPPPC